MNILLATGVYYPSSGGSEISIRKLMEGMAHEGHAATVLTQTVEYHDNDMLPPHENIDLVRVEEHELEAAFTELTHTKSVDLVLTQLMWSERIMAWTNNDSLKCLYFIRSEGNDLDLREGSALSPAHIVANSDVTADFVKHSWRRNAYILPPIIDFDDYTVESTGSAITMVNPIDIKGGDIFKDIALSMHDTDFLAVRGWQHWKNTRSNQWDLHRLSSNAQSFGGKLIIPSESDFADVSNVNLVGPYEDMKPVYADTRLLLVPSLWNEAFGRVAVEAMLNGIPVIASNRGALPEVVGEGGTIINDVEDVSEWKNEIHKYDSPSYYAAKSSAAREQAAKYRSERLIKKFSEWICTL
jgi:glycosyltransferase involved in cell wall biosynthesis